MQNNLAPVAEQRPLVARKVTVGLASHWPCVTELSGLSYPLTDSRSMSTHAPQVVCYSLPLHLSGDVPAIFSREYLGWPLALVSPCTTLQRCCCQSMTALQSCAILGIWRNVPQTDRQTDRRTDGHQSTALSLYATDAISVITYHARSGPRMHVWTTDMSSEAEILRDPFPRSIVVSRCAWHWKPYDCNVAILCRCYIVVF